VAAAIFGYEAAHGQISYQLQSLLGPKSAEFIEELLKNASKPGEGMTATIIGAIVLLIGATGVFAELQESLNMIWNVQAKPGGGFKAILKNRILSFGMILVIGFLLLISLVISALLSGFESTIENWVALPGWLMVTISYVISFAVVTTMFAMIFKLLPDVKLAWSDVIIGAVITSVLFMLGKGLIGLYIGGSAVASTYGAAGSLAVLFVWIYFAANILFLGAEFTQVYAENYGSGITPKSHAEFIKEQNPLKKGETVADSEDLKVESKGGKSEKEKEIEEKIAEKHNQIEEETGVKRVRDYDPTKGYTD
jgi:membrane protein